MRPAAMPPLPHATPPPRDPSAEKRRGAKWVLGALSPWLLALLLEADEERATLFGLGGEVCMTHRILPGVGCPGCGMTRAVTLAAHGSWERASALNPGWISLAALSLGLVLLWFPVMLRGGESAWRTRWSAGMVTFAAVVLTALWLGRLIGIELCGALPH